MTTIGKGQPSPNGTFLFFFFQRLTSFKTCLENKNTLYIDNHNTIRLADRFKSLYISILSQDALNKIEKPRSE